MTENEQKARWARFQAARKALENDPRYGELKGHVAALRQMSAGTKEHDQATATYRATFQSIDRTFGYSQACTELGEAMAAGFKRPDAKAKKA